MDQSSYNRNYYGSNNQDQNQQNSYLPYTTTTPPVAPVAQTYNQTSGHVSRPSSTANANQYGAYQQPAPAQQSYNNSGQQWYGQNTPTTDTTHQVASTLTSLGDNMNYGSKTAGSGHATGYRRPSQASYTSEQGAQHLSYPSDQNQHAGATSSTPVYSQTQSNYSSASYSARQNTQPATSYEAPRVAARPDRIASPLVAQARRQPTPNQQYNKQLPQTQTPNQRAASPAQVQASRQLQSLHADSRGLSNTHARKPSGQSHTAYDQTTTINPTAVYDPWPEYQRKREEQAAKEATENAAREAREAEEARKQKEEDDRKAEEERQAKDLEKEKKREENEAKKKQRRKETAQARKAKGKAAAPIPSPAAASVAPSSEAPAGEVDPEAQILEMMAKIREMNSKHPSLLAKIWEQERQGHLKSQQPTAASSPQPATPATPVVAPVASSSKPTPASRAKASKTATTPKPPAPPAPKPTPTPALAPPSGVRGGFSASPVVPASFSNSSPAMGAKPKGTIWPPEKKEQLSKVAAQFINDNPANAYNTITPGEFLRILDKNPTYIELCETLEGTGVTLDRAAFAKTLLNRVPDINQQQRQANVGRKVIDSGSRNSAGSPPAPVQSPSTSSAFDASSLKHWSSINTMPRLPSPDEPLPSIDPDLPEATPAPTEPLTKAEAARKGINDLVDLTMDSDDDEPAPILKGPARFEAFTPGPQPTFSQRAQTLGNDESVEPEVHALPPPPLQLDLPPYLQRLQQKYSMALEEKCRHVELVQPIDKSRVKRRTKYNPATIARDILLATGKHPDFAPLNAHLEPLKISLQKFGRPGFRIDNFADLSTIRWDAVDPGEPVPISKDVEMEDAPREIDDRIPAKVHPDNSKAAAARRAYELGIGSFGSIRPDSLPGLGSDGVVKRKAGRPAGVRIINGKVVYPGQMPGSSPAPSTPVSAPAPGLGLSQTTSERPASPKRVLTSTPATAPHKKVKPNFSTPHSAPSHPTASPGQMASGSGYAAFRASQAAGEPKKRGRPVGWRKDLHMKPAAGKPNSATRNATDLPEASSQPVNFPIFNCKWSGCTAKLHNLDTLRKHIRQIHTSLECHWEGCGRFVKQLDQESGRIENKHQPLRFADNAAWFEHVEQSHVGPVGWAQGDGPRGVFTG